MGNFDDHMRYGVAVHVLVSVGVFAVTVTTGLPVYMALFAFVLLPFTLIGAMFPDIDHPSSKPNRFFRRLLFLVMTVVGAGVIGGVGFFPIYDVVVENIGEAGVLPVTVSVITVLGIGVGLGSVTAFKFMRPPHRGMTHRVPIGVLVSGVVALVLVGGFSLMGVGTIAVVSGGLAAALFFAGFMSHLLCDGVLLQPKTYFTIR